MLFYLAIGTVAILAILGIAAIGVLLLAAGQMYGENRAKGRWIIEARRREHRLTRTAELWQSKTLERSGLGPLHPRSVPTTSDTQKPGRRFVSASEAVNEMKKEASTGIPLRHEKVPPATAQEFLKDAAPAA